MLSSRLYLFDPIALQASNVEACFGIAVVVAPIPWPGETRYNLSLAPDVTVCALTAPQAHDVLHLVARAAARERKQ